MNLKDLESIIFKNSFTLMRNLGRELYLKKCVYNIKGKSLEGVYHIYGDVENIGGNLPYKPHIKIDLSKNNISGCSCSCTEFKDNKAYSSNYMCSHLNALGYAFINAMQKKKGSSNSNKESVEKTIFSMDTFLEFKDWDSSNIYQAEFRLGKDSKYLIRDLKVFLNALESNAPYALNALLSYSPKQHSLSADASALINFILGKISSQELTINGRFLSIPKASLRSFLDKLSMNKLDFRFNGISYKSSIIRERLPLSFTLKEKEDSFILTTHAKLPQPMSSALDVYFFKGNFYLPPVNLLKEYKKIYTIFSSGNEARYPKNLESYEYLIKALGEVSNNINISEGVKKFASKALEFEFRLFKESNNIYCIPYGIYSGRKIPLLEKSMGGNSFIRDYTKEAKLIMKLEFFKFSKEKDRMLFWGNDLELFCLLKGSKNSISSLGKIILDESLASIKVFDASFINMELEEKSGGFALNYGMDGISQEEFNDALEAFKDKKSFYKLSNGNFLDLQSPDVINFFNIVLNLSISSTNNGHVNISKDKELYLCESLKHSNLNLIKGKEILFSMENRIDNIYSRSVPIPENLNAKLRTYQIKGFEWFKRLSSLGFGGILADDMGLGKTLQTIAFLTSEQGKKSLIISPTSLIYNWEEEFKKFSPSLKVYIAHRMASYEDLRAILEQEDVIITSYGTLRNNIEHFKKCNFDFCIIDEAQNIKNSSASISKLIKEINAALRFALTGTPIENNLLELWSIFDFVLPDYLYSKETFIEKFTSGSSEGLEMLKLLIKPFILRRTKEEVLQELPEKLQKKLTVEMTPMQKEMYAAYIKEIRNFLKARKGKIELFSYITKLRQICLDPSLIFDDYTGGSGKIKAALDIIENNLKSKRKILLFSQFTSALKKIGSEFKENNINYYYLDGATDSKERLRLVNEFNGTENGGVFLISLKAGGTGLNLTSANLVILFDPWWNPAVEQQASDRAHRMGQKNIVEVVKLVAKDSIEEKIVALQEEKKELIDSVITGELKSSTLFNKLSKAELEQLFLRS